MGIRGNLKNILETLKPLIKISYKPEVQVQFLALNWIWGYFLSRVEKRL